MTNLTKLRIVALTFGAILFLLPGIFVWTPASWAPIPGYIAFLLGVGWAILAFIFVGLAIDILPILEDAATAAREEPMTRTELDSAVRTLSDTPHIVQITPLVAEDPYGGDPICAVAYLVLSPPGEHPAQMPKWVIRS